MNHNQILIKTKTMTDKEINLILEKVLLVDCSEDDARAIIANELDKIGIFNPNIEDEIFQNWKHSQ